MIVSVFCMVVQSSTLFLDRKLITSDKKKVFRKNPDL